MRRAAADLDDIDKGIIRALQSDGRLAYSQLGTLVGLSEAAARQRVHRLTERGVMQIVAVTDPSKIGLPVQAMIGITVEGDIDVVAESLAAVDTFDYVVIAAGRYDILVEVVCADADDLLSVVNSHIRSVDGVRTCEILSYLRLVKQTYNWGTG
jgi:Lrp/AsnC family transcriptional regulator for asnA, asnC and gidA